MHSPQPSRTCSGTHLLFPIINYTTVWILLFTSLFRQCQHVRNASSYCLIAVVEKLLEFANMNQGREKQSPIQYSWPSAIMSYPHPRADTVCSRINEVKGNRLAFILTFVLLFSGSARACDGNHIHKV